MVFKVFSLCVFYIVINTHEIVKYVGLGRHTRYVIVMVSYIYRQTELDALLLKDFTPPYAYSNYHFE
jgi:hypothetical protein